MIFIILSSIEILIINIVSSYLCLEKKYSAKIIFGLLFLFSAASLFFLMRFLVEDIERRYAVLRGIVFIIPIILLYKDSIYKKVLIFFTVWIHSIAVAIIANLSAQLIADYHANMIMFILQTCIFSVTTPIVIKYIRNEFKFLIDNISEKYFKYLTLNTILWFSLIYTAQLVLGDVKLSISKLVLFIIITITISLVYPLIYSIAKNTITISSLEKNVYTDLLTGVYSRNKLYVDSEKRLKMKKPFALLYMDLDNFKSINDEFGHNAGDQYLQTFTDSLKNFLNSESSLYRISGDEFVLISNQEKIRDIMIQIEQNTKGNFKMNIPFRGVSCGFAHFPQDGDTLDKLINIADKMMYRSKKQKNQTFITVNQI